MKKITLIIVVSLMLMATPTAGQYSVSYSITFTSIWNADDHSSIPVNAHWSKLVGATHQTPDAFLQFGGLASTGIKNIAETGDIVEFNSEVDIAMANGEADQFINGPNLGTATGDILIANLAVNKDFPLLTLISMIAPSPDWIVALSGLNLLDAEGEWKKSLHMDMFAYDAGTDSGTDYTSANVVTSPFQPVSMINGAPINGNKMGTLSIILDTSTGLDDLSVINKIRVYPNPVTNGKIFIGTPEQLSVIKVELFNSVGSLVKSIDIKQSQNKMDINVSGMPQGIYMLKITTKKHGTTTQKLIIK
ncbi:Por secretion system C-terminal sorting domain-containing protein [Saccharicrinis carchari]|uniref:Por secretion system C-terminal sorting domain-containing protein n=1 Tax=Saccharicrinis carchari TaxID=1168039 RepID=A0A521EPD6_SACCC|nr:spondin domain-containing protein [Saccharicrinis carchari]SMO85776.1 Por secretion system C-terminal sorting domain-containing protein [Saccharicrinis carchari]